MMYYVSSRNSSQVFTRQTATRVLSKSWNDIWDRGTALIKLSLRRRFPTLKHKAVFCGITTTTKQQQQLKDSLLPTFWIKIKNTQKVQQNAFYNSNQTNQDRMQIFWENPLPQSHKQYRNTQITKLLPFGCFQEDSVEPFVCFWSIFCGGDEVSCSWGRHCRNHRMACNPVSLFSTLRQFFLLTLRPARGGDVTVYVWQKPTELAHSFFVPLLYLFVFMALSAVVHFINSSDNSSVFSFCSSGLISVLLVLLYESLLPPWYKP